MLIASSHIWRKVCPGIFIMTEEGVAAARDEIFPEQEAQVRQAAEDCPVNAIEVR